MIKLDAIKTDGLEEGLNFEIVSLMLLDNDYNFQTFETFFGEDIMNYYNKMEGSDIGKQLLSIKKQESNTKGSVDFTETPMYVVPKYFYVPNTLDINIATMVGLGVVKMLRGSYKGKYLLYDIVVELDEFIEEDEDTKLTIYRLLTGDKVDRKTLDKLFIEQGELISTLVNYEGVNQMLSEGFVKKNSKTI